MKFRYNVYDDTCGVAVYARGILGFEHVPSVGEHGHHELQSATVRGVCCAREACVEKRVPRHSCC